MVNVSTFDKFFEENDYKDGEEAQAFADWLASKTGSRVIGISEDGVVDSEHPK